MIITHCVILRMRYRHEMLRCAMQVADPDVTQPAVPRRGGDEKLQTYKHAAFINIARASSVNQSAYVYATRVVIYNCVLSQCGRNSK